MADQFLAEQHNWTLAQNARANVENSWVMLTQDGKIVPIPDERILHTSRTRVGLEILTPKELQISDPFSAKSDHGLAYITNKRVIYIPASPTDMFKSFFAPVLSFSDTHVQSSWIGPWTWGGIVKPVAGGGIPMHIPRIEVRFVFRDGGHSDFQSTFELIKERLNHALEIEPPPPYVPNEAPGSSAAGPSADAPIAGSSTREAGSSPAAAAAAAAEEEATAAAAAAAENPSQPPTPAPNEPPPDYVEAQAQAVAMQYEERMREEGERE